MTAYESLVRDNGEEETYSDMSEYDYYTDDDNESDFEAEPPNHDNSSLPASIYSQQVGGRKERRKI